MKKQYLKSLSFIKKHKRQIVLSLSIPTGIISFFLLFLIGKIYPGVYVANANLSGKTYEQAVKILETSTFPSAELALNLNSEEKTDEFLISLENIDFSYDSEKAAAKALGYGRSGNTLYDVSSILKAIINNKRYGLSVSIDKTKLNEYLQVISGQSRVEPEYPSATITNGDIKVLRGKKGQTIDIDNLKAQIGYQLAYQITEPIDVPLMVIDPTITEEAAEKYQQRVEILSIKSITAKYKDYNFEIEGNDLISTIDPINRQGNIEGYQKTEISKLVSDISSKIDREPQNASFLFEGGRVNEFKPALDGLKTEKEKLKTSIENSIKLLEESDDESIAINIPVQITGPEIKTEDVNNLGIKELIGTGSSRYSGSISSRVYNIGLAASRINGSLIKPGQIFSFNAALGEVDKLTGYKSAYVIKDGQTVLGDGGGVCQVSTTLFRAILDAGLPVIERRAHSYRVGYYEQASPVGFDATVYSPTTDLKIKNDTDAHILVQAYANPNTASLVFELYGTKDGRIATTTKPIVTDVTPPPEDLYTDDPTLPSGTIKQIDYKAWGAKARFTYTVKNSNEITYQKTFYSNYQPWQAKFLRGTGP